ncbi:MAG: glycosyltransferase [Dissulfuribacterales bacterium]
MKELFKYGIDALIARRNSIFGFGWIFHPELKISQVTLLLESDNGIIQRIPVTHGKNREDVAKNFFDIENAKSAGFIVYGGYKKINNSTAQLEIITDDNQINKLTVPIQYLDDTSNPNRLLNIQKNIYGILIKRFIALLKQGIGLRNIIEKVKRYLTTMPQKIDNPQEDIILKIRNNNIKKVVIIIDHDLGGGANKYREHIAQKYRNDNSAVLLLTYHVLSLQYVIELQIDEERKRYALDTLDILFELANKIELSELFYNTAVSFEKPETIPIILTNIVKAYGIPLTIAINDYFMVCPSQFLLDYQGNYCDIPNIKTCQNCLTQNKEGFITLFEHGDIVLWRKNWHDCLELANKIVCFSNSSKTILQKVYPFLTDDKFSIEPHEVSKPCSYPKINYYAQLNIGIVGHINVHKGAKIVQALADVIKNKKLPVKISIIGTIELACEQNIVSITGPYKTNELSTFIEKTGANIFFLPSICPETFSYVTQELILLGVPLLSFDIGAQGERIKQYAKGYVIPYGISPEAILTHIQKFYETIRQL